LAECYGGGTGQTSLNLLVSSIHPAQAGVQAKLVGALLDAGATIEGLDGQGSPIATAVAFGYQDAAVAMVKRGVRIHCLQVAASLGDMSQLDLFLDKHGTLADGVEQNDVQPLMTGQSDQEILGLAFWYACLHEAAGYLLDAGADMATKAHEGFTAVHSAVCRGDSNTLKFLLDRNAPLDTLVYCAVNRPQSSVDYPSIINILINAGASALAVSPYPTGHAGIDAQLFPYRN